MQETFHARFCSFCQVFLVTLRQKTCPRTGETSVPREPSYFIHEWTTKWTLQLSEDKVAEFLTKTERKKLRLRKAYCSMDVFYVLQENIC